MKQQGKKQEKPEVEREPSPLAKAVAPALHRALPEGAALSVDEVARWLETPPELSLGDLAFPCFRLAKALRKGPPVIARELAQAIAREGLVAEAVAAGPYVNLRLDPGRSAAALLPALARREFPTPPARDTRVMVEYSQPNTHKAFHVGHMRNVCLGDALVRLLRADGYEVIAANYYGDVGAHIAKCLWWYLDVLDDAGRAPPAERRGEWLGDLYASASIQLEEWDEAAKAGDVEAAAKLAAAKARTTEILQRLEARDPALTAVWRETRAWSLAEFAEIYAWSGVHFDAIFFESQVDTPGLALVEEYLQKGVFTVSDGAVGIFNEEVKHMPFFMLRKQDGTSLYATKDLALARMKFEEYGIDRSIYVVDVRQSDHFRHVFLTLAKMGFAQADRCEHVAYEFVELPEGPMSGRKGTVILFRSLREQMTAHVISTYLERLRGAWTDAEIDETARANTLGAIKYGMLARDVNQKIVFEMEAWLDIEGNTGPYLQYTHARARSILRKCEAVQKTLEPATRAATPEAAGRGLDACASLVDPRERELILALDGLEPAIRSAARLLRPSLLCTCLYNLCKAFNRFNAACPVKPSEGSRLQGRLLLVTAFCEALARGLDLLGIPAPERM
ncbi:MAG: arginine--tRNA ligase [Nannocystaceae bacterium]